MIPPAEVLEAFGLGGAARRLDGGAGGAHVVGDVVLKRADDEDEAAWVQELAARLVPTGFRLAAPVPTVDGRWSHASWTACEWLPGLRPAAPDWAVVVSAGRRFTDAANAVTGLSTDLLSARCHRWARADRSAWDEEELHLDGPPGVVLERLRSLTGEPDPSRVIVHGDLTGNVHLDGAGVPVVLDLSPYLRPARWSEAIVLADALLWWDAPWSLAATFTAERPGRDLLARALVFRLLAEPWKSDGPGAAGNLGRFDRVVRLLSAGP